MSDSDGLAAFVVPHWTDDFRRTERLLLAALDSITGQTDSGWRVVLIDDASPEAGVQDRLRRLAHELSDRIVVLVSDRNEGPGVCRNRGVRWASEHDAPFVLFNDADDLSAPTRLESVRRIFRTNAMVDVVYSTFRVVDQAGRDIARRDMTASVAEVLQEHDDGPPQGHDAWIAIGTETGYVNHTSSTAVRTALAVAVPFPPERVSEDAHTWFRYSARGGAFAYIDEPLSCYRTTIDPAGSSSRSREGGKVGFYTTKARVDTAGFLEAAQIAIAARRITADERDELLVRLHLRLALTMAREHMDELAEEQIRAAIATSPELARRLVRERGLGTWRETVDELPNE